MKILHLKRDVRVSCPTVVCLGFFDGLHIGHQRLIGRARAIARAQALTLCVHTFDRMPAQVLNPRDAPTELTPFPHKSRLLTLLGVGLLAVSRFEETMGIEPGAFFQEVLLNRLCARHVVAGFDHRFGRGGKGDAALLRALCEKAGVGLDIIGAVTLPDGELVSSTAIRRALAAGDHCQAARMLGRPVEPSSPPED